MFILLKPLARPSSDASHPRASRLPRIGRGLQQPHAGHIAIADCLLQLALLRHALAGSRLRRHRRRTAHLTELRQSGRKVSQAGRLISHRAGTALNGAKGFSIGQPVGLWRQRRSGGRRRRRGRHGCSWQQPRGQAPIK